MASKNRNSFSHIIFDENGGHIAIPIPSFSDAKRSSGYKKIASAVSKKAKRAGIKEKDGDFELLAEFANEFVESFSPRWIRLYVANHENPTYTEFLREDFEPILLAHYALVEYIHTYVKSCGVPLEIEAFDSDLFSLGLDGATSADALETLLRSLFDSTVALSGLFKQMSEVDEDTRTEKEARVVSVLNDMGISHPS
jgi:hypothetical protein